MLAASAWRGRSGSAARRAARAQDADEAARARQQQASWQNDFVERRRTILEEAIAEINSRLRPNGYVLELVDRAHVRPYGTRLFAFQLRGIAEPVSEATLRFRLDTAGQIRVAVAHPLHQDLEAFGERRLALEELTPDAAADLLVEFVEFVLRQ